MSQLTQQHFFEKLASLRPKYLGYAEIEFPKMLAKIEAEIAEAPFLSWVSLLANKAGHSCTPLPINAGKDKWQYFKNMWPKEVQTVLEEIEPELAAFAQKFLERKSAYVKNQSFRFENNWLYSGKQWQEEQKIADVFEAGFLVDTQNTALIQEKWADIQQLLNESCGSKEHSYYLDESQKEAVLRSLLTKISVITGGPGTGKTTTAHRILEAFVMLWPEEQPHLPKIKMTAPTGKAAARLMESMSSQQLAPKISDLAIAIALPKEAVTLHRLLGMGIDAKPKFDAKNPIDADLILIDEASMIDQYLMKSLLNALKPTCRLILIGDRHQLPSVEAGAVFSQLYPKKQSDALLHKSVDSFLALLSQNTSIASEWAVAQLQKGHRSGAESGINKLATIMQNNEPIKEALVVYDDVELLNGNLKTIQQQLKLFVEQEKAAFNSIKTVDEAFEQIKKNQFLTVINKSKFGADSLNEFIFQEWASIAASLQHGMRIIIRQNDYENGLFNGEIGIYLKLDNGTEPKFYFEGREAGSEPRAFLPQQLNKYDFAFALTVHKSQGSEYENVYLIAPDTKSRHPLFSKELLYTAITRSKKQFTFYGDIKHFKTAAISPQLRFSQLQEKLWEEH